MLVNRGTSLHLLEQRVFGHAARAHIARETWCEFNDIAVLCAALYELEILQRHLVVVGGIKLRCVWHEGEDCRRGVCRLSRRKRELVVPTVEVKSYWLVQTCKNGLQCKLLHTCFLVVKEFGNSHYGLGIVVMMNNPDVVVNPPKT